MESKKLKSIMIEKDYNAEKLLDCLYEKEKISISKSAFYRKLKGESEFTRIEIIGISEVLGMSDDQIINIFFRNKVS